MCCFNGATSCRTWKLHISYLANQSAASLQWGHVLSDVETIRPRLSSSILPKASMGPRPVGRGNHTGAKPRIPTIIMLQWGHVLSDLETPSMADLPASVQAASMGPRPVGRGNTVIFESAER